MKTTFNKREPPLGRLFFAFVMLLGALLSSRAAHADQPAHRLVSILQYLETDYPAAIASKSTVELEEQRVMARSAVALAKEQGSPFLGRIEALAGQIEKAEAPSIVAAECATLVTDIAQQSGLLRAPRKPPELANGKAIFDARCASCHGAMGKGDGVAGAPLEPRPANLVAGDRAGALTPYRVFNTTAYGIPKTAMVPFVDLDEKARWDVAFYVLSLRHSGATCATAPKLSLERLANAKDAELGADAGCLRVRMPEASVETQLMLARTLVEQGLERAKAGDFSAAKQAVLAAYLDGVEPIEPLLRARDAAMVTRIEQAFLDLRAALDKGDLALTTARTARVIAALDHARVSAGGKGRSVFGLAFLILIREGFEVTVVLGALLAVLKKTGRRDQARVVHLGWVAALVVGIGVFFAFRKTLAGSSREWLEGSVTLAAVAMLLYAAFFINSRANTRRMMGDLRERTTGAIAGGKRVALGLFVISFSSMLRESVETALFLQGLAIDSPSGAAWGAVAGVAALVALIVAMDRFGVKLPMQTMFTWSTRLLFATAVVLLGKGLHALQEVGVLPLRPVGFVPRLDVLGLFPDLVSFLPQILLIAAPFAWLLARGGKPAPAVAE